MGEEFWEREPHEAHDEEPLKDEPLSEEEIVEDPEALRRAEEAVAHETVPGGTMGALAEVFDALEAEGVPAGWDPYDPREAVGSPFSANALFARQAEGGGAGIGVALAVFAGLFIGAIALLVLLQGVTR